MGCIMLLSVHIVPCVCAILNSRVEVGMGDYLVAMLLLRYYTSHTKTMLPTGRLLCALFHGDVA